MLQQSTIQDFNDNDVLACRFKQRGKEAEEACNVFYYLTYEGSSRCAHTTAAATAILFAGCKSAHNANHCPMVLNAQVLSAEQNCALPALFFTHGCLTCPPFKK